MSHPNDLAPAPSQLPTSPCPDATMPAPPAAGPAVSLLAELWLDGQRQAAQTQMPWLWHGYLAPGNITLLTRQWKSGKTTLVSVLLRFFREVTRETK